MTKFQRLHKTFISAMHDPEKVCQPGYAALLRVNDADDLAEVVRKYWADLNRQLWPTFQPLLQQHYAYFRDVFIKHGIRYNEGAESGLCVVDANVAEVILSGNVNAIVHDGGSVSATKSANVCLYGSAECIACGQSRITAYNQSRVYATDRSTVRAMDESHVIADGAVTIYLADKATIDNKRSFRIYNTTTA